MKDEPLAAIEADARALLDAMLDAQRPAPDAADMLERVSRADSLLPIAAEHAEIPALALALDRGLEPPDPQLAAIEADARLLLDAMLAAEAPPARATLPRPRLPRHLASAAAAVLLFGLAGAALANNWRQAQREAELERFAASSYSEAARSFEALEPPAPARVYGHARVPMLPRPPPQPAPVEPEADAPPSPDPAARKARLAELDAQAYAHLRAGQRREAAAKFEQITKIGGRSEYAELAFGELFALARQQPGVELGKLWRAYLRRFPKGRYADAAHAGLCRQAQGARRQQCWTDYLHDHPRGAARSEALRERG